MKIIEFKPITDEAFDSSKQRAIEIDEFGIMESHSILDRICVYQKIIDDAHIKIARAINNLPKKLS